MEALGSWSVTGIPLTIEYSLDLMDQVRAASQNGRRQLSRGGVEVGGALFGSRGAKSIRILAWRPITCEYARGPAFVLSPNDRTELAKLLHHAANDPDLTGLYPLGWFVSHTRTGVEMTASDRKIYRHFFPAICQTTLVLNPAADGSARAGFFLRDASGEVPEVSPQEFTIDGVAQAPEGRPDASENRPLAPISNRSPFVPASAGKGQPPTRRRLRDYRAWIWIVPVLLALIVVGTMVQRPSAAPKQSASFSLHVDEVGGDLRLEWDRNADVIRAAARGSLDIKDGTAFVPIPLDSDRLHDGYFDYTRLSGEQELRMTVYPLTGTPVTEHTKFVGPRVIPPEKVDDAGEASRERDRLKTEVEQLREGLRKVGARNRQLEETVRILERRVQVQKLLEPKQ